MNYRTTRIYIRSLELIDFVARVNKALPPGFGFLADQSRRAAASVTLNYIEGCGRTGTAERKRFFHIAVGSALEVAGTFDVMRRFGVLSERDVYKGHVLCDHVVAMLRRFR